MAKRSKVYDYDLIVIGSGAGGGVAAHIASREGKKVAIIEAGTIGGECPNYGCVPTKALLTAAEKYRTIKESDNFGVRASGASFNFKKVKAWKDLAVKRTGTEAGVKAFEHEGIEVIKGRAHFIDEHTVSVHKKRYSGRYFVIASGTHNFVPPVTGLKEAGFISHRQLINLDTLPKSVFIIGGGAIGCEFASILGDFDSEVIMAEFAPRLAAREDSEAGEFLEEHFKRRGIEIHTSTEVFKVEVKGGKKIVHFKSGNSKSQARVDEILLAAGMRPTTDLGLENAGVEYSAHGIITDNTMQTSAKHIYAAGDVTGPYAYTHMASYQSRVAVHNIFKRKKVVAKYHAVPRVIFTDPELASVGLTESQLAEHEIKYRVNVVPTDIIGRANTTNQMEGFVKVMATPAGVIVGATIAAPRAGEMIHELALATNLGLKVHAVSSTIHAFPTWSEAVRIACHGLE